jgi:hypothetical protein
MTRDFLEHLETLQALGRSCLIKWIGDNGGIITIKAPIKFIHISGGGYIKTETGLTISLDRLVEVEGKPAGNIA